MATKIRPIVFKIDEPDAFIMNGSDATIDQHVASWEGPNYPDGYDGVGKTLQIIVKEEGFTCNNLQIMYAASSSGRGPGLIVDTSGQWLNPNADAIGGVTANLPVGTYNVSIIQNVASTSAGYGKYITLVRNGSEYYLDSTLMSKIELRIID